MIYMRPMLLSQRIPAILTVPSLLDDYTRRDSLLLYNEGIATTNIVRWKVALKFLFFMEFNWASEKLGDIACQTLLVLLY